MYGQRPDEDRLLSVGTQRSEDSPGDSIGQGRQGFRDFPGLLMAKENRHDSRQTLPI